MRSSPAAKPWRLNAASARSTMRAAVPRQPECSERDRALGMRDEHRHAVGDRHCHRRAASRREVPVRVATRSHPSHAPLVLHHARAVHLLRGREARSRRGSVRAMRAARSQRAMTSRTGSSRMRAEAPRVARRRERRDAEATRNPEGLARRVPRARRWCRARQPRRSSTRVMRAPSARSRSSMRS